MPKAWAAFLKDENAIEIPALDGWTIDRAELARPSTSESADTFPVTHRLDESRCKLHFASLFDIVIDTCAKRVSVAVVDPDADTRDLHHILYDHVAPRLISLDRIVLHGAAVAIDGQLAILIGDTGAGKSTLSASLAQSGHALLGDDAVVISQSDEAMLGEAVYPSLRLHQESVAAVFEDRVQTQPMARYSAKQRVEFDHDMSHAASELPIAAIFHLAQGATEPSPSLTLMPPAKACLTCMGQSFALDPEDPTAAQSRIAGLARLTSRVPVYSLHYPRNFSILPDVHDLVAEAIV